MTQLTNEAIKQFYIDHITSDWAGYLTTVMAAHSTDPVTLVNWGELIYGARDKLKLIRVWPAIAFVSGVDRETFHGEGGVWSLNDFDVEFWCYFKGIDLTDLVKTLDRTIEAFKLFFLDHDAMGGKALKSYGYSFEPTDTILDPGSNNYAQGLRVRVTIQYRG